jgi:hypothetical protein
MGSTSSNIKASSQPLPALRRTLWTKKGYLRYEAGITGFSLGFVVSPFASLFLLLVLATWLLDSAGCGPLRALMLLRKDLSENIVTR